MTDTDPDGEPQESPRYPGTVTEVFTVFLRLRLTGAAGRIESMVRYPAPLRPGDKIAVTSPSAGASGPGVERVAFCVDWLRAEGYEIVVGECMDGSGITSAPAQERAAELTAMLCDPDVRCVLPPWGGETAIDLVDLLDWDALDTAEPTWLVGYSDISTVLLPITTRLGWATVHGDNLADTPYRPPAGLLPWIALASGPGPHLQRDSRLIAEWWRFNEDPKAVQWREAGEGEWRLYGAESLEVSGRLIGGCIEAVANLAGTPYGDVAAFGEQHASDGLIVYLEAAEAEAATICRNLHALRLAGWFENAKAILIGRTNAVDNPKMTQEQAVLDALGRLDLPIVFDVEIGHVPPHLPLVNGAMATLSVDGDVREITQVLR
ncbi:S66 peptidase family protein [Nocardioides sp. DS6]|uniref:S66 peptidase family protein n=1 Tax=Nocardioides eburneus TaxID=3231482 RepID=A0ABV3SZX1_9ACTN